MTSINNNFAGMSSVSNNNFPNTIDKADYEKFKKFEKLPTNDRDNLFNSLSTEDQSDIIDMLCKEKGNDVRLQCVKYEVWHSTKVAQETYNKELANSTNPQAYKEMNKILNERQLVVSVDGNEVPLTVENLDLVNIQPCSKETGKIIDKKMNSKDIEEGIRNGSIVLNYKILPEGNTNKTIDWTLSMSVRDNLKTTPQEALACVEKYERITGENQSHRKAIARMDQLTEEYMKALNNKTLTINVDGKNVPLTLEVLNSNNMQPYSKDTGMPLDKNVSSKDLDLGIQDGSIVLKYINAPYDKSHTLDWQTAPQFNFDYDRTDDLAATEKYNKLGKALNAEYSRTQKYSNIDSIESDQSQKIHKKIMQRIIEKREIEVKEREEEQKAENPKSMFLEG